MKIKQLASTSVVFALVASLLSGCIIRSGHRGRYHHHDDVVVVHGR